MPHLASPIDNAADKGDCITCDFCSSDVFQSFFECRNCGSHHGSPTHGPQSEVGLGDGLIICPSCYVEGRSCKCEVMTPVQCRPFDVLLRLRRRAMTALASLRQDHDIGNPIALVDEQLVFLQLPLVLSNTYP
jgi:hypothetical protein